MEHSLLIPCSLVLIAMIGIGFALTISGGAAAGTRGFELPHCLIDKKELRSGEPPKDGIAGLTNPKTVPAGHVDSLCPSDQVIGVARGGEARAYPLAVLIWDEAVNDTLGASRSSSPIACCATARWSLSERWG